MLERSSKYITTSVFAQSKSTKWAQDLEFFHTTMLHNNNNTFFDMDTDK